MALRGAVLVAAGTALIAGLVLWRMHGAIGAWIAVEGAVVALALLVERGRYRGAGRGRAGADQWQATPEVFVDPTTGKRVRVHFNPATGARRYDPEPEDPARR